MKLTDKEILANRIYGEDAKEVLDFLAKVAPDKHEFRNGYTFLNFIARKLEPMLKKKARNSEQNAAYWNKKAIDTDTNQSEVEMLREKAENFYFIVCYNFLENSTLY